MVDKSDPQMVPVKVKNSKYGRDASVFLVSSVTELQNLSASLKKKGGHVRAKKFKTTSSFKFPATSISRTPLNTSMQNKNQGIFKPCLPYIWLILTSGSAQLCRGIMFSLYPPAWSINEKEGRSGQTSILSVGSISRTRLGGVLVQRYPGPWKIRAVDKSDPLWGLPYSKIF